MKKIYFSLVFFTLFLLITPDVDAQSEVSVQIGDEELKSASKARSIAFSNTVIPMGLGLAGVAYSDHNTVEKAGAILAVYGLVMGPSTGNFHAEDYNRGSLGMAVRAVGTYLMSDASREIFGNDFADALGIDDREVSLTDTKILIGEILVLGSIAYNILSTKASVEAYNNDMAPFTVQLDSKVIDKKIAPVLTAKIRL